jgi:hypothetical protein
MIFRSRIIKKLIANAEADFEAAPRGTTKDHLLIVVLWLKAELSSPSNRLERILIEGSDSHQCEGVIASNTLLVCKHCGRKMAELFPSRV